MKKILVLVMAALLVCFALAACNKGENTYSDDKINEAGTAQTENDAPEEKKLTDEKIRLTFSILPYGDNEISDELKEYSYEVLKNRAQLQNYRDIEVTYFNEDGKEFVCIESYIEENVQDMISYFGASGFLTFFYTDEEGEIIDFLKTEQITGVSAQKDDMGADMLVLNIDDDARKDFAKATKISSETGEPIYIMLDDTIISAPFASAEIDTNEICLTGDLIEGNAAHIANLVSAGALPWKMVYQSKENVE